MAVDPVASVGVLAPWLCALAAAAATQRAYQGGKPRALQSHESHVHEGDRVRPPQPGLPTVRGGAEGLGQARRGGSNTPVTRGAGTAQIGGAVAPILYAPSPSESSSSESASWPGGGTPALRGGNGAVLILVLRSVGYGSAVQGSIQGFRANQGLLEDLMSEIRRFDDARVRPAERRPIPSMSTSTPWSTPTTECPSPFPASPCASRRERSSACSDLRVAERRPSVSCCWAYASRRAAGP